MSAEEAAPEHWTPSAVWWLVRQMWLGFWFTAALVGIVVWLIILGVQK